MRAGFLVTETGFPAQNARCKQVFEYKHIECRKENWAEHTDFRSFGQLVVMEFMDLYKAFQENYFQLEEDVG